MNSLLEIENSSSESAFWKIQNSKKDIIDHWEKRCRQEISCFDRKDSAVICEDLDLFLNQLASHFRSSEERLTPTEAEIVLRHGLQRSQLQGCTLNDIIREYAILRQVIIEVLSKSSPLNKSELKALNAVIDSAMELAGEKFAQVETSKIKSELSKAQTSNRALESFASVIAHDFKSPLATLSIFTESLEEDLRNLQASEVCTTIRCMKNTIQRASDLIDGILNYSRVGAQKPNFKLVDMNEVVQAAKDNLEKEIKSTNAEIIHHNLPQVSGSFCFLVQLIQNLISNSIKFRGPHSPRIEISAQEIVGKWRFQVQDNGIGFSNGDSEKIFKMHERLHSEISGHGIGLATCRRVVELHQGQIWAESSSTGGARFFFTLPKIVA